MVGDDGGFFDTLRIALVGNRGVFSCVHLFNPGYRLCFGSRVEASNMMD